jgi:hypothetical protein
MYTAADTGVVCVWTQAVLYVFMLSGYLFQRSREFLQGPPLAERAILGPRAVLYTLWPGAELMDLMME